MGLVVTKTIELSKEDLINLVCEKYGLDASGASFSYQEKTVGEYMYGGLEKEFKSIKITVKE